MKISPGRKSVLFFVLVLASSSLFAVDINKLPPDNWAVPARSPARSGGLGMMSSTPNPTPFQTLNPCRIADTRGPAGLYGAPPLSAGVPRNFTLSGQCGIPGTASAVSLNVTVTNTAGPGFIFIYPAGGAAPTASTLNYVAGQTIANAAIVPLGAGGAVTVIAGVSGTDLILDTNGYFYDGIGLLPAGEQFSIIANIAGGGSIYGQNSNATGSGVWGNNVYGGIGGGIGVLGTSIHFNGVWAQSTTQDGLAAFGGRDGGYLQGVRNGVIGVATSTTGVHYGVLGSTSSTTGPSAGVFGQDSSAYNPTPLGYTSGVTGNSRDGYGVLGQSRFVSVFGQLRSSTDVDTVFGLLGTTWGVAADATTGPWAVFAGGNFGATGTKHFVEPHPTDAKKVIMYSSLEGREVGTYFRGTARIVNHQAIIEIPEDFRIVTDEEGLTVQVTPIGGYSQVYIESQDLAQIVVKGSRDVQFHYLVQGVRRAFKDLQPVQTGYVFMPQSASDRIPAYLTVEAKRRLISNGTYNEDGTVNMSTAEKAGFTKIWADAAAEKAAAARAAQGEKQQ
jgi:hypothetical protein